jgi:hypothetical protein
MSNLDKHLGKKHDMRPAVEIAAERWGMKNLEPKEAVPETVPEKPAEKRNFKDEFTAWGERPQQNAMPARSDTYKVEEPKRDEQH